MYNALQTIQAFEAGQGQRKERERETAMKGIGNALAGGDIAGATAQAFRVDPMYGMQLQQYGDQRNALNMDKEIGGLIASGDMKGASAKAYGAGRFDVGMNIDAQIRQMTQEQRENALFLAGQMGNAGMTLKGITDPQQRMAAWQGIQSRLVSQYGMDAQALAQFNPLDDAEIDAAIGEAQTFAQRLEGQRRAEDVEFRNSQVEEDKRRFSLNYALDARQVKLAEDKAAADAAAETGVNVDDEGQFRREYNTITKEFRDVQAAYGRIKATDPNTAAGQISLVFQYMKMLDPGSTVREGEFATAENARGVPEGVMNTYNAIMRGTRLTQDQINDFKGQAGQLYRQSLTSYDRTRKTYEGIAQSYGFDLGRTVPDLATMRNADKPLDLIGMARSAAAQIGNAVGWSDAEEQRLQELEAKMGGN